MTEQVESEKYLDNKNRTLFNDLISKGYKISLEKILDPVEGTNTSLWQCRPNLNEVRISYYNDIESTGFFTHELYHVDIIDKGFPNMYELITEINREGGKPSLIIIPCIGQICNVFAHEKFYNDFIGLNYLPNEFVSDYDSPSKIQLIIDQINLEFNKDTLPNNSITFYINFFFTAMDNNNPDKENDYNALLEFLNEKDPILFGILNGHWKLWKNSTTFDCKEIIFSLIDSTVNWHNRRKWLAKYFI